ncbi:MAG: alkaline phosphatase family protein [Actinomycetota bacterium]|nr:alkaline phosphatase family protein [Actinomycetota bacterium]
MLMKRSLLASLFALLLAAAATAAVSGTASGRPAISPAASVRAPAYPAAITKLLVIVEENENANAITPGSAPYISGLSATYAYASNYRSVGFPSLPNYLAITGGSTFGITTDGPPSQFAVNAPSVFGQALKAGRTARVYSESATSPCDTQGTALYAVRHNPWLYFRPEAADCRQYDLGFPGVTSGALATDAKNGTLPNVGLVDPNLTDDGHTPGGQAGLANADKWLRKAIPMIQSGPDWKAGHLAIVITWDSGAALSTPTVDFIVVAPTVSHLTVTTALNHYSLSRLMSDFGGSTPLSQAKSAPDMRKEFHL